MPHEASDIKTLTDQQVYSGYQQQYQDREATEANEYSAGDIIFILG